MNRDHGCDSGDQELEDQRDYTEIADREYEENRDLDEDEDDEISPSVLGPKGPRLMATKCSTCIFHPGNRMHLQPGRVRGMVDRSLRAGSFITCHKTLPISTGTRSSGAICRGFFDAHGHRSNVIRIYDRLGGFDEVTEPEEESCTTTTS